MTFYASFGAKLRRNLRAVANMRRDVGLAPAIMLSVRLGISFARNQASYARDRLYDLRTGLDTVHDRRMGAEYPGDVRHLDGEYYERVTRSDFRRVMHDAHVTPHDVTFIDLGCGKGAALLLAKEYGFTTLVGVEFNPRLAEIARDNFARLASRTGSAVGVSIITADACDFSFPSVPSVIFMYNPFGRASMDVVLRNLSASLGESPRDLTVVYVNPVHVRALDECSALERLASEPQKSTLIRRLLRLGHRYGGISWVVYRDRLSS